VNADGAPGLEGRPAAVPFRSLLHERLSRRSLLAGAARLAPLLSLSPSILAAGASDVRAAPDAALKFRPIDIGGADKVAVADGHRAEVLLRWGDPLFEGTAGLDVATLADPAKSELLNRPDAGALQERRFGYNCDYNGYFPLPRYESAAPDHGLLATNHEYTDDALMFAGFPAYERFWSDATRARAEARALIERTKGEIVRVQQAAHGLSIVEIRRRGGRWSVERRSPLNRRVTATTPMDITGPAAGHPLMRTEADPTGRRVLGTLANCSGGRTPWGTVLTGEENVDAYFANYDRLLERAKKEPSLAAVTKAHARLPLPSGQSNRGWELVDARFDAARHPTEALRFGWCVEIDPYDPASTPRKLTALGRFKHEAANTAVAKNGQVAVYSGDDAEFEYLYKFVSAGRYDPAAGKANGRLLEDGTLHAARFDADGRGRWLPLVFGQGPLVPPEFESQADVVIKARRAADLLGATPMDRPEDVEVNPLTGRVYAVMTKNTKRRGKGRRAAQGRIVEDAADAANPRQNDNANGHIVEIAEDGDNAAAATFAWDIFILCGNPMDPSGRLVKDGKDLAPPLGQADSYFAGYGDASRISPLGAPDNIAFDRGGNLWIATDGQSGGARGLNLGRDVNDGLYAVATAGPERGRTMQFLSGPVECEIVGPEFTPDDSTLFVGIQHPGTGGVLGPGPGPKPESDWPDGKGLPPRPSVLAITRANGKGPVGRGEG
jgi:secreted PhoX family phosphatase